MSNNNSKSIDLKENKTNHEFKNYDEEIRYNKNYGFFRSVKCKKCGIKARLVEKTGKYKIYENNGGCDS